MGQVRASAGSSGDEDIRDRGRGLETLTLGQVWTGGKKGLSFARLRVCLQRGAV